MKGTLIVTSRIAAGSPRLVELVRQLQNEGQDVAILFVGDGVYSLVEGSASSSILQPMAPSLGLLGCKNDVESRGIAGKVTTEPSIVDYDKIVELIMEEYSRVLSYF